MIIKLYKMKKTFLTIALTAFFFFNGMILAFAQEQPKPQKDTVNIDTDAKPKFYYAVEDEKTAGETGKSSVGTIAIIAGAVIVVGGVVFFLLKKKR
jgi:LPXTG-motif cell wall-anchored protein